MSFRPAGRWWRLLPVLGCALVFAYLVVDLGRLTLALDEAASIDAIRVRNSLVSSVGAREQAQWTPASWPGDYHRETLPPPRFFADLVDSILPATDPREGMATALALARHLRRDAVIGDPLQANTRDTYDGITSGRGGYCSDYTQVFNALALAAGLHVREWGFTWDDLSNGHAFNEVWDAALGKWVFIDSFWSFYVVDAASGTPLSVLELRDRLLDAAAADPVRLVPVLDQQFGFKTHDKALNYYRRGLPRMFLLMANDVYSYDADPVVQLVERMPRAVEMLVTIVAGEHPRFVFIPPAGADDLRRELERMPEVRTWFIARVAAVLALGAALLAWAVPRLGSRRGRAGVPRSRTAL